MIIKSVKSVLLYLRKKHILFPSRSFAHRLWVEPPGYYTNISIYNSLIKKKVKFLTQRKKIVTWYCCGPTVYDTAHIGNLCSYMHFDIIRRIMENYFKLNVIMVMNITDIDDKIIARSNQRKIDHKSLTNCFEMEFFEDLKSLNILLPTIIARVTNHIPDIIEFIEALIKNGYGYVTSDGSVYFSVAKFSHYGKFQSLQKGVDDSNIQKEDSQDFALWKSAKPEEPFWYSPWGKGRPGWHIECSAIASKFLGNSIDLHSGGIDLKFPHHENEEAQCCARFGTSQWVNYWLHTGHLFTKSNEKMSKSLSNTETIKDFLSMYSSNTFRTFCLTIPYRNNKELKTETLEKAAAIDKKFSQFIDEIQSYLRGEGETLGDVDDVILFKEVEKSERAIKESLSNDFDTNKVVEILLQLISTTNSMLNSTSKVPGGTCPHSLAAVSNLVMTTLQNLGYTFTTKDSMANNTDEILNHAVHFRNQIREIALGIGKHDSQELKERKKVLLGACDSFRNDLLLHGIELKDRGKTSTWNIVKHQTKDVV